MNKNNLICPSSACGHPAITHDNKRVNARRRSCSHHNCGCGITWEEIMEHYEKQQKHETTETAVKDLPCGTDITCRKEFAHEGECAFECKRGGDLSYGFFTSLRCVLDEGHEPPCKSQLELDYEKKSADAPVNVRLTQADHNRELRSRVARVESRLAKLENDNDALRTTVRNLEGDLDYSAFRQLREGAMEGELLRALVEKIGQHERQIQTEDTRVRPHFLLRIPGTVDLGALAPPTYPRDAGPVPVSDLVQALRNEVERCLPSDGLVVVRAEHLGQLLDFVDKTMELRQDLKDGNL